MQTIWEQLQLLTRTGNVFSQWPSPSHRPVPQQQFLLPTLQSRKTPLQMAQIMTSKRSSTQHTRSNSLPNSRRVIFPSLHSHGSSFINNDEDEDAPPLAKISDSSVGNDSESSSTSITIATPPPSCSVSHDYPSHMIKEQEKDTKEHAARHCCWMLHNKKAKNENPFFRRKEQEVSMMMMEKKAADDDCTASTMSTSSNKRPSILRSSRFSIDSTNSNEFLLPPASPLDASESPSLSSSSTTTLSSSSSMEMFPSSSSRTILPSSFQRCFRSVSEPWQLHAKNSSSSGSIQFNPNIGVREFSRTPEERHNAWFSERELHAFKSASLQTIQRYNQNSKYQKQQPLLFSHPSLSAARIQDDEDDDMVTTHDNDDQVRAILILDPHDICAHLFAKGFKLLFPHARVETLRWQPTATLNLEQYDIIVCEERWDFLYRPHASTNGAAFLQRCAKSTRCVLIGTSAQPPDQALLLAAGADLVWTKPPPRMDTSMRTTLLDILERKRKTTNFDNN